MIQFSVAIYAAVLRDFKRKIQNQIEDCVLKFAILVDHIRNPLTVIQGYAEIYLDEEIAEKVKIQVGKIKKIVEELEEGWVNSEKIRVFLERDRHVDKKEE